VSSTVQRGALEYRGDADLHEFTQIDTDLPDGDIVCVL